MCPSNPSSASDETTWQPPWPAPRTTTVSDVIRRASVLIGGQPDGNGVQFVGELDLAAEPAAGLPRGRGEVEHLVLILTRRRQPGQVVGVHVHVARRAGQ